jgi:hypothetical protein
MAKTWRVVLGILICSAGAAAVGHPPPQADRPFPSAKLAAVLKKAGEYCARLDSVTLYFVCLEDVTEKIYDPFRVTGSIPYWKTERNNFVYDFQMIRKDAIEEKRILLNDNNRTLRGESAALQTQRFRYKYIVFGPLGLFGAAEQSHYRYQAEKEERLWGRPTVVVQAAPVTAADSQYVWGKAWLDAADGSILKIVWAEESLENYADIRAFAAALKARPELEFSTEFRFSKNGIRFPSRFTMNEAYREESPSSNLRRLVKSDLEVLWRDYKFFTVEVESKIIR